jgi:hypothetical protein
MRAATWLIDASARQGDARISEIREGAWLVDAWLLRLLAGRV